MNPKIEALLATVDIDERVRDCEVVLSFRDEQSVREFCQELRLLQLETASPEAKERYKASMRAYNEARKESDAARAALPAAVAKACQEEIREESARKFQPGHPSDDK